VVAETSLVLYDHVNKVDDQVQTSQLIACVASEGF